MSTKVYMHISADHHLVRVAPVLGRVGDFAAFLADEVDEAATFARLRRAESIGRPIGSPDRIEAHRTQPGAGKCGPRSKRDYGLSKLSP